MSFDWQIYVSCSFVMMLLYHQN